MPGGVAPGDAAPPGLPRLLGGTLPAGCVVRIGYADRHGAVTSREVEPFGYVCVRDRWYLIAWCRLRESVRIFRSDRITSVTPTRETAPPRSLSEAGVQIPHRLRPLSLT